MRVEFLQTIDFNQMLVYSTFVHLFFLVMVAFLPSPKVQEKIIVPTFRLDLIELYSAAQPVATSRIKKKAITPMVTKRTASIPRLIAKKQEIREIKVVKPKILLPPQPRLPVVPLPLKPVIKELKPQPVIKESKTNKKVLADLETLQRSAPKKSILQKLDEVVQVVPKPRKKKVVSPKPMQEETFEENQRKKMKEFPLKSKVAKVQPIFDDSKIKTKKLEPIELLKESAQTANLERTTASDLIKELEAIESKKIPPVEAVVDQKQPDELNHADDANWVNKKPLVAVAEKFKALEELSEEVRMNVSQDQVVRREFETVIRKGEVPILKTDSEVEKSNLFSDYVGKVYKRVYSKWKTPPGSKFKKVVVAFTVFTNGNIDKPVIRESSGNENLDSIAVRAILDAVPLPVLPKELSRPNLRISIIFKYVPEKN